MKPDKPRHRTSRKPIATGPEHRVIQESIEVRGDSPGSSTIGVSGLTLRWGVRTPIRDQLGEYGEVNTRGCVTNLATADVRFLVGHDQSSIPLGRTTAGTMQLRDESDGLWIDVELSKSNRTAMDLVDATRRGDISGLSVGFSVPEGGDSWNYDYTERVINRMNLLEVSAVAFPAVESTSLSLAQRFARAANAQEMARLVTLHNDLVTQIRSGATISKSTASALQNALSHLIGAQAHNDAAHGHVSGLLDMYKGGVDGTQTGGYPGPGTAADGSGSRAWTRNDIKYMMRKLKRQERAFRAMSTDMMRDIRETEALKKLAKQIEEKRGKLSVTFTIEDLEEDLAELEDHPQWMVPDVPGAPRHDVLTNKYVKAS